MQSTKSLKVNMILNAVKGLLGIIFPLITFPYVSKILGVTNIGKYNFVNSIINYGLLVSALGIKTYAVREGAKLRNSQEKFNVFVKQMFTINMLSTLLAYGLLIITVIKVPKLTEYRSLLFIMSFQILFTTLGVEWLYTIFEDFAYITVLNIVSHIVSLVLLFAFVHTEGDLNRYATIVVVANVGSNIVNFFHSRKYCQLGLSSNINWKKHLKPVLILFSMQIATTIYISSDITILGFICNDNTVGIYSVSTKIYGIIKTILSSIIIVSIPRLASLVEHNKGEFTFVAKDIYQTLLTMVVPSIVGIIMLRKQIILIVSDETYLRATSSLVILCVALLFCLCAWFWGQCILVLMDKETFVLKSTIVSAVINVIMNFIMIPIWAENAAAFTTLISEAVAFVAQWWMGRKYVDFRGVVKCSLKVFIGCISIYFVGIVFKPLEENIILYTLLVMVVSIISYGVIEVILKNDSIYNIVVIVKKKLGH